MTGRSGYPRASSTKIVPPSAPALLLARPRLEARLAEALERRLTTVVADAGFGKSSLLSSWATTVHSAWYTATQEDVSLDSLARGIFDALTNGSSAYCSGTARRWSQVARSRRSPRRSLT